jgi:hypothetical protein
MFLLFLNYRYFNTCLILNAVKICNNHIIKISWVSINFKSATGSSIVFEIAHPGWELVILLIPPLECWGL